MDGILLYNEAQGRYLVKELIDHTVTEESRTIDLHCGDTLKILVKRGDWRDTRIVIDSDDDVSGWYFVGVDRAAQLIGHSVKI